MRSRTAAVALFIIGILGSLGGLLHAQTSLRKIGELELQVQGISATVSPTNPTIPKNTAAGVRIVVTSGTTQLSSTDVASFLGGPFVVHGELSGPGLNGTITLPFVDPNGGAAPIVDPLILPIPALTEAGDYTLSNLRITVNGSPALDVNPSTIPVKVIDQVLITSVETRPLTLDEIKASGVVLDSNDFLGFQFTVGLATSSNATTISFPVVFDRNGVPIPTPLIPPSPPMRESVPVPTIVPVLLSLQGPNGQGVPPPTLPDGTPAPVKIPSVLVIPGDVGFLKQFFSAQLFVANGAPGGSGLVVHDVTGTINLPPGADGVVGTADDPLTLPNLKSGPQPLTKPVMGVGPDGQPGTADDTNILNPGDQGQAEFIIEGQKEGFQTIGFNIQGTLDGLATGSVTVTGTAQGGVLVRNPFFDMTFAVPGVVRTGDQFMVYVTVKNISQAIANAVSVTINTGPASGVMLMSDQTVTIDTIAPGGATTLKYQFKSLRTGQVVASYLHFDTTDGTTGQLQFMLGVGDRGIPLSPDTLVLPQSVQKLPQSVVDAAILVLGEGWSIANAPAGSLPPSVIPTNKSVVTQKALALAEAGLRVGLGQPTGDAIRDLMDDFYGGTPLDPGFDQLLHTTDAGREFERALGAALAQPVSAAGGVLSYQSTLSQVYASGTDFVSFAVASGSSAAPVDFTFSDNVGNNSANIGSPADLSSSGVPGFAQTPLGNTDASPILGLLTEPLNSPYTLKLTGNDTGSMDLAVAMPHGGDGTFIRGEISDVQVTSGSKMRIVMDFSQPDRLVLEQDTNNDGTFATQTPLRTTIISPLGPNFISATVIGPETLPGASSLGVQMALLFDRVVDGTTAQQVGNYSIPNNAVQQSATQLSGRIVLANLQEPEGTNVPTTVTVNGIADLRGVIGKSGTLTLQSRIQDPGAVVSGRVLDAQGNPVNAAVVTYSVDPPGDCQSEVNEGPVGVSAVTTGADGRYQFRFVRQDQCGVPFQMSTQDPSTGGQRVLSNFVRFAGQQIIMDFVMFGRGSVAGKVSDLNGNPMPGATVVVLSQTDSQIGAQTTTDGSGNYSVSGITVGPVTVNAGKGASVGHSAGTIPRAGNTATINVTLDSGSINVSGQLSVKQNGVTTPVPNWPVVYSIDDHPPFPATPVAVVNTDGNGNFTFTGVPEGNFIISAQLTATAQGKINGFAVAGQPLNPLSLTILIDTVNIGSVSGQVQLPGGKPVSGVLVSSSGIAVLSDANGNYTLQGLPVRSGSQTVMAQTQDGLRTGTFNVSLTQPGQAITGANIVLSGLGTAKFTVKDSSGNPVKGQAVTLLGGSCPAACGCNPITTTVGSDGSVTVTANPVTTDSNGVATFTNQPVGTVKVKAISAGFDVADGSAVIPADLATGSAELHFNGSGSVTGNVLNPDNTPSFGANIAMTSNVFEPNSCELMPSLSQQVATDTSGNFKFTNVKVGPVGVSASQPFFPTQVGAQGTLSGAGQNVNFNLKLVNTISGVLSGTVFLPDGVTPAGAGVQVTANGVLPDVTVNTDVNGHFAFAKIFPEGNYTLTASDPVTGGVIRDNIFLRACSTTNPSCDMVHDLRLKGVGTVTVQIIDGSNQPVNSATVTLTEASYPNGTQDGAVQPATQGIVTFQQVFEGPFTIAASDLFGRGGRTSSVLPGPGATVNVVVQLTSTGTVQGHFFMPDGVTPIPFGTVQLFAGGRLLGQMAAAGSGDVGSYSFTFVPAGPVTLQAQDPVTARTGVAAGTITTDGQTLMLDVTAQGLGTVTGQVTSNGSPQPGANVDVFSGSYHATTVSDSTGTYMISGVPEGHIVVNASFQNGFLAGSSSGALTGDGSTLSLNVAMRGSGGLTGQVDQADGMTPASASLVTVQVGGQGGGTLSVTTDAKGNFSFPIVPAGTATVTVNVLGSIDEAQTSVEILSGATVQTSIRLNGIGSINEGSTPGHTLDSAGNPIQGQVTVTGTGAFPYSFTLTSSTDGSFSLPVVLAGTFTANLSVQSGTLTLFGSTSSSVQPNQNTNINIQVQPSGTVTGKVFRSDGVTPAAGANVTLTLAQGSVVVQAQTDGTFMAQGVPLGGFSVRINDPISTGQALVPGQSLTTNGQKVDLGNIVLNDTPMAVVSFTPSDGSTDVPVNSNIVVAFTDALQSASGISITANGGVLNLAGTISTDGKMVTFNGPLPDDSTITVTVDTSVSDIFGRHPSQTTTATFQTKDMTPPRVVSVSPQNGTNQIASSATITVNFNEALATNSNLTNLIVVNGPSGAVTGTTVLAMPSQAVFTPSVPLPTNGAFTVTVNGETDPPGNVQTVPFVSTFLTVDTIPPVVSLASPANGGFTTSARPGISFSATDALTGVDIRTATLSIDGQQVATGTLSFTPATNLADGTHTVSASVADGSGNVGTATGSFTIDTQPPSAATVSGVTAGQIVTGTVPLTLSATDATSGVAFIDLLVDGNFFNRVNSPFQLSFNSASISDGNHTLSARATDVAGNVGPIGPAIPIVVNNVVLTVTFTSPAAGTPFNSQFTATATTDKSTQRVDFSFLGQTVSVTTPPYSATFSVAAPVAEGNQTVSATAFDFAGNSATANLVIVVDRTPPVPPNTNLINAEPPVGGVSQVHGLVGSVEAFSQLQITNVTHPVTATANAASDGTFSTTIAGSVDDTLSLVSVDAAGNRSPSVLITIRETTSLPPATGNTSLNYAGDLVDRVGTAAGALSPDGSLDAVFTLSLNIGSGVTRTLSRIDISNGSITHSAAAGAVPVGVSPDVTSAFLNRSDGSISIVITSGATLTLITADNGFIVPGSTYTATASFTDGSRFVGTFVLTAADDHQLVAHSATITANPSLVTSSSTSSGTSTLTITNIRDINGTLLPDGSKIALTAANAATTNGFGDSIPSAGGSILDGTVSANNPNFKIFTISDGTVTATYSAQPASPPALTGSIAVIQMVGADSAGNVLGTEAEATQDINLHAVGDPAIVGTSPGSLYADNGDHRSHVTVQVRDSSLDPVPDGTRVAVSVANDAALIPGVSNIGSVGGTIIGGTAAPTGPYRIFATTGGSFSFDYSDSGMSFGTDRSVSAVVTVLNLDSNGSVNNTLIGSGTITLVGPADAEMSSSMISVPAVSPTVPVTIDIFDVHDARGNLVPDGATILVSPVNDATVIPGCCNIASVGGSLVDGTASPNSGNFRYYTLASNRAAATYTTTGVGTVSPGSTAVTNIQLAMGDPSGNLLDNRLLKLLSLTLVAPSNAVGNAQPGLLLGDGGIHTATVTFNPILDTLGNTLPDGSKVAVSVVNNATVIPGVSNIMSAGGQVLSGTTSPSDPRFQIHTVTNGGITVSYADQNLISTPGQIQTANLQLAEARSDNSVPTTANISTVGIQITGLTSASVTTSATVLFADGNDRRATVTVSNLKDSLGKPVPDGTNIAVSTVDGATVIPGIRNISSPAGGTIIGGTTLASDPRFQIFPVQNGQVVFQYSAQGIVLASGSKTATVQIAPANSSGGLINNVNIGSASIQLLAPASATVNISPSNLFSDGGTHTAAVTISNLKDSDGVTPLPDGARIGISVDDFATVIPGVRNIDSAGGQILSAGTTAGDGTVAGNNFNNSTFDLFTIAGGQVLATYSDAGIVTGLGQTQTVNVQLVSAASNGTISTNAQFADGSLLLHGITSATGNGPASLSTGGGTATITFSGIKDNAGNLVPDGTLVIVTAANDVFVIPGVRNIGSAGGSIVDGGASPSGTQLKVFMVQNGTVTVTYSPAGAAAGQVANIQITGAKPDGSLIANNPLNGGVFGINITN